MNDANTETRPKTALVAGSLTVATVPRTRRGPCIKVAVQLGGFGCRLSDHDSDRRVVIRQLSFFGEVPSGKPDLARNAE
jgi:hypothetical protein